LRPAEKDNSVYYWNRNDSKGVKNYFFSSVTRDTVIDILEPFSLV